MNVAFRPALPEDFDYCERLYFAEMERINRELNRTGPCESRAPGVSGKLQRIQRRDVGCNCYDVIVG